MKLSVFFDKNREEEVILYLHRKTDLIEKIEDMIESDLTNLVGYTDCEAVLLYPEEIFYFFTEDNKVFAASEKGKLRIKQRLYVLEESLGKDFVKINQSCIANIKKIKKFDFSVFGALSVVFKNGDKDFVSRRQMKSVKERIGLN